MTSNALEALVPPIECALGRSLLGVTYWCLHHETTSDKVLSAKFYHGGFTELRFDGATLIASWAENAGWVDGFSLAIDAGPASHSVIDGYHEPFDASRSLLWGPHVGSPLRLARLLGWNATPHALELGFSSGAVVLADGYELPLGDGDDIVHWPAEAFWHVAAQGIECLWRAGAPQG